MSDGGMSYLQAYGHFPNLSSPSPDSNACIWSQSASPCSNKVGDPRCQKRRNTANKKERRRTLSINMAFSELRNCIPQVPADTKLSKIKTLKLATSYIAYLMALLDDEVKNPTPFNTDAGREPESQSPNSNLLEPSPKRRKTSGRTGWPQQVWALTLKRENPS